MNQTEYETLVTLAGAHDLARPFWKAEQWNKKKWEEIPITVLICQRKTKQVTQLCLESLLRFYPDVKILIVDGDSQDDSTLYLKYTALKYSNVKVWLRTGRNSHGETMHEAIMNHITTDYVLLMDSDVITMRGGMIEGMLEQFRENPKLYATGNLMLVTRKNQACGQPEDGNDVLRYAHPCLSVLHIPTYKRLHPSYDHGAALCENMIDAERKGWRVETFPVDKYSIHISGSSWQQIPSVYNDDADVPLRPFVTFITTNDAQPATLSSQRDNDFNIVPIGEVCDTMVSIHGIEIPHVRVQNALYNIRFRVNGEYVCVLDRVTMGLPQDMMTKIKEAVIAAGAPKEINVGGLRLVERKHWQATDSLYST